MPRTPAPGVRQHRHRQRHGGRDRRAAGDGGMVTAELAVGLPVLVAVLLCCCGVIAALGAQLRCADAARLAALAAARGEPAASVFRLARSDAPAGATVVVSAATADPGSGALAVRVQAPVTFPGPLGRHLPHWQVTATVVAALEPGVATP